MTRPPTTNHRLLNNSGAESQENRSKCFAFLTAWRVVREKKSTSNAINTNVLRSISQHTATNYEETLEDALIDLYLSVKIRSNEEVRKLSDNIF